MKMVNKFSYKTETIMAYVSVSNNKMSTLSHPTRRQVLACMSNFGKAGVLCPIYVLIFSQALTFQKAHQSRHRLAAIGTGLEIDMLNNFEGGICLINFPIIMIPP